ncbi:MAG: putative DNA ligase-like protein [Firmicutes bacterium ADurb.Bin300]|nr:MAG: putative DNA ligase-like protein [Firmicutes bacterium ADurb.Bin300]
MPVSLDRYNRKRNFDKTFEPEGITDRPEGRLRFAVQHHIARKDHYDLRLEWDGVLLSWAVPKGPSFNPRDKRLAVKVEDHPLEYRNFEGTIPKGEYGGGVMMLWDEGIWEPRGNADEALAEGALKFELKGRRLNGNWALIRLKAKAGEAEDNWLFLKEKDEHAKTCAGIAEFNTSVRTGRTMAEIENGEPEKAFVKNPFEKTDVQLAKLVNKVPEDGDWLYELKYDGYRIIAYMEGNDVRLMTRNGGDYTKRFWEIAKSLADWASGRAMVLDGEMVITDAKGKSDFQALQSFLKNPGGKNLTYIVFDILALNGEDLRGRPLIERKETLEALMRDAPKNIHYSRHVKGQGKESFIAACEADMEGIVGKRADSVYSGTRNGDWIKLKCDKRQEFVIGGYTLSDKKTRGISSLLLGVYEGGKLVYAGRAGTGFTQKSAHELEKKFEPLIIQEPPFAKAPEAKGNERIFWLEPVLVAEIKFAEWTDENLLRQASFKGLREDKDPRDVRRETPNEAREEDMEETEKSTGKDHITVRGIRVSSPDKVVFEDPEITKADVVRYYASVAERMLPFAGNRILSIVRCPKGISGSCFYKKHPGPSNKGIVTIPVMNGEGETEEYFYIENASGLLYEAQMGTLEFHTWGSRADDPERPDMMVFDLDPDEGLGLDRVREGVRDLKSLLDRLSLVSFLKTSGGKGYHVVVPFKPCTVWEQFHEFARRIAEVMERERPDRYTSNVRKAQRKNRIFIDWIRNGRGATSIAAYSLRARKGAPVSMPIAWEELDTVTPDGIKMADALERIKGKDPWKDYFSVEQKLK